MPHSKYLESLTKEEYRELSKKLWAIQNHKCFICGEDIDLELHETNIDHIRPLASNGKDEESNFAITHEHCNKSKQDSDLEVAKRLVQLSKIMKEAETKKETPSLKHVLEANGGSKYNFSYKIINNSIQYAFSKNGDNTIRTSEVYVDKLSGETTTFIKVPIEYLYHDEIINPRGINSSIGLLIKEFHKGNPQLHISLARLDGEKIKIFDGQHKAVAQIMLGVRELLVRIFINTDVDRMIETNTVAGSKLKQIAFDKSIVRQLHDTLYSERIRQYQLEHGKTDDDLSFSESELVEYFKGERGSIKQYIINSQKNIITKNPENKLQSYINFEGRGSELPLSYSTFEKTMLSTFINNKTILDTKLDYKVDEGLNPRILEKNQIIHLCNIIAENILIGKYDSDIGTYRLENKIAEGKGDSIPDDHLIACRLFKEEVMYNWVKYIELLIKNQFAFSGEMYDDKNLFQQPLTENMWGNIENFVNNLRELPVWKDRGMSSTVFGGKQNYDYWLTIFKTGRAPDSTQVLVKPINTAEMIKK